MGHKSTLPGFARVAAASGILGNGLFAAIRPGQELIDVVPEPFERRALVFRQLGQFLFIADAGEVGVFLPVLKGRRDLRLHLCRAGIEDLGPSGKLGLEPFTSLAAELGLGGVIGRRLVLAVTRARQRGGAGGVVAMLGLVIVGTARFGRERLGPEPGGGGMQRFVVGTLGQLETLAVVPGSLIALEDPGQSHIHGHHRRVGGAESGEFLLSLGRAFGVVQPSVSFDEIVEIIAHRLPEAGVRGIDREGLALRFDGLPEQVAGLLKPFCLQFDHREIVQYPA